jgi:hypothetical protein
VQKEGKLKMDDFNIKELFSNFNGIDDRRIKWMLLQKYISTHVIHLNELARQIFTGMGYTFNYTSQFRSYEDYLKYTRSNFHGGNNDNFKTKHENMFHSIFPELQFQRSFGTGNGGYKKYGTKRYIADFVDDLSQTVIEIDGDNHKALRCEVKDKIREYFFSTERIFHYSLLK